jgi:3-dehydroquinate synthase
MHLDHIGRGGDPFESGSSRPLDFGHWAAHKLEHISDYRVRHGEAVAVGIAIDTTYSYRSRLISESDWRRVMTLLSNLGFDLHVEELESHLDDLNHPNCLLRGLNEFREHLGGRLTIMLLRAIGKGIEVHEIDERLMRESILMLRDFSRLSRSHQKASA